MSKIPNLRFYLCSFAALGLLALAGCIDPNYNSPPGGYSDPYSRGYPPPYGSGTYEQERERRALEDERIRLERERKYLEEERRRNAAAVPPPPPPPPVVQERCPAGFHPREQRCSDRERRNGCKDMRLSNGMGCVNP